MGIIRVTKTEGRGYIDPSLSPHQKRLNGLNLRHGNTSPRNIYDWVLKNKRPG
jgi:hypothetical protein